MKKKMAFSPYPENAGGRVRSVHAWAAELRGCRHVRGGHGDHDHDPAVAAAGPGSRSDVPGNLVYGGYYNIINMSDRGKGGKGLGKGGAKRHCKVLRDNIQIW